MILAVHIGNSIISVGFFDKAGDPLASFDLASDIRRTSDEYLYMLRGISLDEGVNSKDVTGVIISSVVPQLTDILKCALSKFTNKTPMIIGPGVKTGFHIKIDNPSELGADMVANTAAANRIKKEGRAAIVVDLRTVNTVSAIGKSGEYLGCSLFPGVQLSLDSMRINTAQLPNVNISSQSKAIGKHSHSAIRSGVILGNALTIDGLISRFAEEMNTSVSDIDLIATGECAQTVLCNSKYTFHYDEYLTLKGLYYIYTNNVDNNR